MRQVPRNIHTIFSPASLGALFRGCRWAVMVITATVALCGRQAVARGAETADVTASDSRFVALRTNLLSDAVLIPDIGLEVPFGHGEWSVCANWHYSWWFTDRCHRFWQTYGGDVEIRRWFGRDSRCWHIPAGHHVGVYAGGVTYDFEWGGRGYQSDRWGYMVGLAYGFSLPLNANLNLDMSVGIGYMGGRYKEYVPVDNHYVWQATKRRHWFGPTKAEVTLVWKIDVGRMLKGGGR